MMSASVPLDLTKIQISPCNNAMDMGGFCCGDPPLDRWVTKDAKGHNERNFVRIFCAHNPNSTTVLLYALALNFESTDKLLSIERQFVADPRRFPAIFIRCLATARHLQGNGLGKIMLMDALTRAYQVSKNIPVFGVGLTSLNERTTRLYQAYGFGVRDDGHTPTMILPIWSLRDLIDGRGEIPPSVPD